MISKRAPLALALLCLAGCSRPPVGYPPHYELNFMGGCEARSTIPGLCACTWAKIEAEIAPADFAALERLPGPERQAHPLTQQIEQYAFSCAAALSPPPGGEPAPTP